MKIVCDDKIPFLKGVFEPFAQVVYLPGKQTTAEVVRDADAIITRTRTRCDRELLEGSCVKVIATATIGFDHIDTAWCEENGIIWKNAPGCNSGSVMQYICSVLATLARKHDLKLQEMTLGVVGVGNVGSKVARAASLMGMKVLLCDPPRAEAEGPEDFVSLDELIAGSDIVTLHVPLEKDTFHLFDAERLASMSKDQILINSSRGEVVDNLALKAVLERGALKAAVLDVWEREPDLDPDFVRLLDVSTPHIAGYSADGKANGTIASVRTVAGVLGIDALKQWEPKGIPNPAQEVDFSLDARGLTVQETVSEAILYTYDVLWDSGKLRSHLEDFEALRGDYQIRREFPAFTIHLRGGDPVAVDALEGLGFTVIEATR